MKTKVLITAANGNTGFPAALELLRLGLEVRAFVRNPNSEKATQLKRMGAEIFVGNILDIRDVRKSLIGVDRVYLVPTYPNLLFQGSVLLSALRDSQVEHVVLLTQWLSSNTHYSVYTKEHWLVDDMFKRSALNLTILNPGLFGFVYFLTPEPLAQFGMLPDFGENAPPSNEDIGQVAAHILNDPAAHRDKTYRVTGKEVLSAQQMAQIISNVLKRKVKVAQLSEKMILKVMKASGLPKRDASQVRYYIKEGHHAKVWSQNAPTSVVRDIVGKEADDFETLVRTYLLPHPMAKQTFTNKLKALKLMVRAVFTKSWDLEAYEKEQGMPQFSNMGFSTASEEWQREHLSSDLHGVVPVKSSS